MDTDTRCCQKNPAETANPLNRLFFWWTVALFRKGSQEDLDKSDIYAPLKCDESERLGDTLEKYWNLELEKLKELEYTVNEDGEKKPAGKDTKPRLQRAIIRAFWWQQLHCGFFVFVMTVVLRTIQPILQGWIIHYFDVSTTVTKNQAIMYCVWMIICIVAACFMMHHTNLISQQIGMRVRVACSSLMYRKILRLSRSALTQTTAGQVVNLLSNDLNRFDKLPLFLHYIWIMPFQLIVVGYVLWQQVGISTIIGIGSLLLCTVPVNIFFSVLSLRLRAIIAPLTDRRVQLMDELVAGIQVVKMYAWEIPFEKIVSKIRASEIRKIEWSSYVRGTYIAVMIFTERMCLFITLVSFVCLGNPLTPEITYVLATFFNILQLSTAMFFPQALIMWGETTVSIDRVEQFLLLDEVTKEDNAGNALTNGMAKKKKDKNQISLNTLTKSWQKAQCETPVSIELKRASANWTTGQLPPTLCNVSFKIKPGELCALIGPVGSGKSSILHLLLRELPLGAGTVSIFQKDLENVSVGQRGYIMDNPNIKISYASQDAWLFAGSVRDNILFGQPYERNRYVAVTKACALSKDFKQLPQGDMTIVGERGTSLSGGQRARVNLARAVYRQADIYLLDDPLSAVDTRVAKHLFTKCIQEYLKGKTRILVTHQLQFVQRTDVLVALDRGGVKIQGCYDELLETNQEFVNMLNQLKEDDQEATNKREQIERKESQRAGLEKRISLKRSATTRSTKSTASSIAGSVISNAASDADSVESEAMEKGRLSGKVYKEFFCQGGSYFSLILLLIWMITAQVATSGNDYWVSYWTNVESLRMHENNTTFTADNYLVNNTFLASIFPLGKDGLLTTNAALYVYTFCIISCIVLTLIRSFHFMRVCMNTSKNLHQNMFSNILQATMRFFHLNSSGRILNRFSKDIGAMDELLPKVMLEALQIFFVMCGILVVEVVVNHWMIIPIIILGIVCYAATIVYLNTAQTIKRLEGVTKSPVFSHVNATLNGLPTIRSSGEDIEKTLRQQFDKLQDVHSGAWYLTLATASAFGLVLDIVACIFVTCVCFSFVLMDAGSMLGGDVGLAITQALIITGMLQYGVRQSADGVSQMTAVERVLEYTNLPKEGPLTMDNPPPPSWPPKGKLSLTNVSMKYDEDDPPVLKDLNLNLEPGWKVGIVGRTGAGKSSLISVLFRLFADTLEGEVKIDGRDTSTLGLRELRSRISIIPQEPVLFSASLRYNLDPFGQFDDAKLWEVLREVELCDTALDQKVLQNGSNFSVGQKQLICLARAILRNNRILVLDEATANIDSHTDALIQDTIRSKFANCTVLTIAHRLNTIIDSDRVIVMENGRVVEFNCPYELLCNKNGHFYEMVQKTGRTMAQSLFEQAEKACHQNAAQQSVDVPSMDSTDSETTVNKSSL